MVRLALAITLLLTTILIVACPTYGQTKVLIEGKVIDGDANESLPGASVYVEPSLIGTVTDINGQFSFSVSQLCASLR